MNHCPVYNAIGGHAYGSGLSGSDRRGADAGTLGLRASSADLPNASTFLRALRGGLPGQDPAAGLMRRWREVEASGGAQSAGLRLSLATWAFVAKRPASITRSRALPLTRCAWPPARRAAAVFPLARGWTRHRDLPAPEGRTFQQLWAESQTGRAAMTSRDAILSDIRRRPRPAARARGSPPGGRGAARSPRTRATSSQSKGRRRPTRSPAGSQALSRRTARP